MSVEDIWRELCKREHLPPELCPEDKKPATKVLPLSPLPLPSIAAGGAAYRHGGRTARNLVPRPVDSTGLSCTETRAKGWTFAGGKGAIRDQGFEVQDDPTETDPLHFLVRPGQDHIARGLTMASWQATRDTTTEEPATWHELTRRLRNIAS